MKITSIPEEVRNRQKFIWLVINKVFQQYNNNSNNKKKC